jgi:hypothetical protein
MLKDGGYLDTHKALYKIWTWKKLLKTWL